MRAAYLVRCGGAARELIYFDRDDLVGELLDGLVPGPIDRIEKIILPSGDDISCEVAREVVRIAMLHEEPILLWTRDFLERHYCGERLGDNPTEKQAADWLERGAGELEPHDQGEIR